MKIYSQLKTLALLCALPISSTFAAEPAKPYEASSFAKASADRLAKYGQAVIPASLQAELKRIEDLPDHKALTEVAPIPIYVAAQCLRESEDELKDYHNSLASSLAKHDRSALKFWTIKKELTSCPDGALKQILQIEHDKANNQWNAHRQEEQICANHCIKNQPDVAYNFMTDRHDALACQASILLAQKETEKAQWQIKESQWQQEKQSLKEKLKKSQEDLEQLRILHRRPLDPKAKEITQSFDMQKFVQLACIKKKSSWCIQAL